MTPYMLTSLNALKLRQKYEKVPPKLGKEANISYGLEDTLCCCASRACASLRVG